MRMSGWSVFGSLVFGLLLGLLIFHLLTRRLQRLAKVMDNFRKSDFSDKVALTRSHGSWSGDEIEGLETTFAEMTSEAKNKISHRGRAVQKLATFLKTKN